MCVEVWNTFQRCDHRVYQNTFACNVARQCAPGDDLLLKRTKFLPDTTPSGVPPSASSCNKIKQATRPLSTKCPICAGEERIARMEAAARATAEASTMTATTTASSASSPPAEATTSASSGDLGTSPSPGGEGIQRVRESLAMLDRFRKISI
ncbi:hypothetical protein F5Y02DRAFT_413920 [Annulohypoxylon stygium]|nr:hypothetical protein F5Y02DRAFT_413920 [Annulohypoxylon stygium]